MNFILHEALARDSYLIKNLKLCQIRLINNVKYPWIILIPQKENIIEITDFNEADFNLFNNEVKYVAKVMHKEFKPDKLNIATIGNVVPQLHMHIVARYKNDKLFPKTVWGHDFENYSIYELEVLVERLRSLL